MYNFCLLNVFVFLLVVKLCRHFMDRNIQVSSQAAESSYEGVISLTGHGFNFCLVRFKAWKGTKQTFAQEIDGFCGKYKPPDIPHHNNCFKKAGKTWPWPLPNMEVVPVSSKNGEFGSTESVFESIILRVVVDQLLRLWDFGRSKKTPQKIVVWGSLVFFFRRFFRDSTAAENGAVCYMFFSQEICIVLPLPQFLLHFF